MPNELTAEGTQAVQNMHQAFLEALRHREQEVLRYLAILGPALSGFVWLLMLDLSKPQMPTVFATGSLGVILLLLLGAVYSLSLGYNYRYLTLQLAKLERKLEIEQYVLEGWPRSRRQFLARYRLARSIPRRLRRCLFGSFKRRATYRRLLHKPWCTPPEIIKVFWWAFLVAMVGVTVVASIYRPDMAVWFSLALLSCLAVGWLSTPYHYGSKLRRQCRQEPMSWDPSPPLQTAK